MSFLKKSAFALGSTAAAISTLFFLKSRKKHSKYSHRNILRLFDIAEKQSARLLSETVKGWKRLKKSGIRMARA